MTGIFTDSTSSTGAMEFAKPDINPSQSFLDIEGLAFDLNRRGHLLISEEVDFEKHYDDAIDRYEQLFGERLPNPWAERIPEADDFEGETLVERQMNWFNQKTEEARLRVPPDQWHLLPTRADIEENVPIESQKREEFFARVSEGTGLSGAIAEFLGTGRAFLTDPPTLLTLPFGIGTTAGRGTLRSMGQAFMRESLLAGTAETLTQPTVQERRKGLGFEDAGFGAGARNVLAAAIASGTFASVLVGGGKELAKQVKKLDRKLRAAEAGDMRVMADELRATGDPTAKVLADDLDVAAKNLEDNPLNRSDKLLSGKEHDTRTRAADEAIVVDRRPDITDQPKVPVAGRKVIEGSERTALKAETVQVREGAWKGLSEIADPTPQQIRATGKVLGLSEADMGRLMEVAPRSTAMIRDIGSLTQLSDRSFRQVLSGDVDPKHAMLVQRVAETEEKQDAIIDLLVDLKTRELTDVEVESIIRQASREKIEAGKVVRTESSLFRERAKVMDIAVKKIRGLKTRAGDEAAQLLPRMASKEGALSDALTQAAREAAETGRFGPAAARFVDSVREAAVRGDFDGERVGAQRRPGEAPAESRPDNLEREAVADGEAVTDAPEVNKGDAQVGTEIDRIDQDFRELAKANPNEKIVVDEGKPITLREAVDDIEAEKKFLDDINNCII